jgi:hypothetical protein
MDDARATVVTGDHEPLVAERGHHVDLVLGHHAERVVGVIGLTAGLGAVAVATEIGYNDRELLGECGSDLVPHHERLRAAVQQQERRAASADDEINRRRLRGIDAVVTESVEHLRRPFEIALQRSSGAALAQPERMNSMDSCERRAPLGRFLEPQRRR